MRPLVHRTLAAATSVVLAATLVTASSASAETSSAAKKPTGERYVALGDSFVAGPGIPNQRPEVPACARSDKNFVSVFAGAIKATSFTDASCSGATTDDWWTSQDSGIPPQFDALKKDTTLVTLGSMGGNDVGLVGLAQTCLVQGCSTLPKEPFHQSIDALAAVYRKAIAEVHRRSPGATIVAVGYGTYVPLTTCPALVNATDADLVYLQGMIDRLSDTIEKVAKEKRIAFVDMRDIAGWRDHTACAAPEDQWIRGLNGYGDGITLHPSTAGMAQMANQTLKVVRPLLPTSSVRVNHAAKTLKLRATCSGPRRQQRVTLRVTGGQGLVKAVSFRVGKKWVATDRRAPFTVTRKASSVLSKKSRGPVTARVGLRHGQVRQSVTLSVKRPSCLR